MTEQQRMFEHMFPVDPSIDFDALERSVLAFWEEHHTFERSVEERDVANSFVFYDGPPFATGLPHYGHILTSIVKDVVPRFRTMLGQRVERRWGWDCHGVPVEFEIQNQLGLAGRNDIEQYGIGAFNDACQSIVLRYVQEWQKVVDRIGRWVDFENDYKTMDTSFMESVWWAFKQLWDRGLIYEDYKVVHFSWRLGTPLSNFEATLDDAYRERTDPSVTAKFRLEGEETPTYVLAWTTTPWTLPSNMALAVNSEITYALVEREEEGGPARYILAESLLDQHLKKDSYTVLDRFTGEALVGRVYEPLFPYFADQKAEGAFRVRAADFVRDEDGTGIVHIAPAFGEDDFNLRRQQGFPLVNPVDDAGNFTEAVSDYAGINVFEANPLIVEHMRARGSLFATKKITHAYPHCWRTDTPLIYRAISSWYVRVSEHREDLLRANAQVNWYPANVKDGIFGNWLANARDWAISRSRYWGTPLPVWRCAECGVTEAVGSIAELEAKAGVEDVTDLHRQYIDDLTWTCTACGGAMQRVPDVLDCWFESGSMPYGQTHYPFENRQWFEENFPSDFIVEYIAQTRGWFYTLVVLSALLFDKPPFENCIVHGNLLAADGRKMSKRLKNYPDPLNLVGTYGADALRLYLMSSPVITNQDVPFLEEGVRDAMRSMIIPLWNAFSFLTRYAELDGWRPDPQAEPAPKSELDRWILSLVAKLEQDVKASLLRYDIRGSVDLVRDLVDALTNWYIRRSRRRFWRSEGDADKRAAYETLHTVLVNLAKITAPLTPFVAEVIYKNLTGGESVHLELWPEAGENAVDATLLQRMRTVRDIVAMALSLRGSAQVKVRQPLSQVLVRTSAPLTESDLELIRDEVNVKEVRLLDETDAYAKALGVVGQRAIGPRFRGDTQKIAAAAREGRFEVLPEGAIRVAGREDWVLSAGELKIHYEARTGYAAMAERDTVVVLDLEISEALRHEGLVRDIVRVVQSLRKEADYRLDERITVGLFGLDEDSRAAVEAFGDYLCQETLCTSLVTHRDGSEWDRRECVALGDDQIEVAVRR
ncbi:MAG: isoleucine--tRNA ligase [Anaerolineae bacterium]